MCYTFRARKTMAWVSGVWFVESDESKVKVIVKKKGKRRVVTVANQPMRVSA